MATPRSPRSGNSSCTEQENFTEETLMATLLKSLHKIPSVLQSNAAVVEKINSAQSQVIQEGTINPESRKLLSDCYTTARPEIANEIQTLKEILQLVQGIKNLRVKQFKNIKSSSEQFTKGYKKFLKMAATSLPLWVPERNEPPPQLCGAIAASHSYIAKSGDLVAALVKLEGKNTWIVAEVVAFQRGKYKVKDIDEVATKRFFTLKKERVKPLPLKRASPELSPTSFFTKKSIVLAMYPTSTCLYKARVHEPPKTSTDRYQLLFSQNDDKKYNFLATADQQFVTSD